MAIDTALAQQRQDLAHAFQGQRCHYVAGEFHQVGGTWVLAQREDALRQPRQHGRYNFGGIRRAGNHHKKLACIGGIGIAQHRCRDIGLPGMCVLFGQVARQAGADRAHRNVNGAAWERFNQSTRTQRDIREDLVVRQ